MKQIINPTNLIPLRDRKILIVRRADHDIEGGKWALPGGKTDIGENFEQAMIREVKEEIGCDVKNFSFFRSYFEGDPEKIFRTVTFYGEIEGEITLDKNELSEYAWINIDKAELEKYEFAWIMKDILSEFIDFYYRE